MSDRGETRGRGSTRSAKARFRCVSVGRRPAFADGYRSAAIIFLTTSGHTWFFGLSDGLVIDGGRKGNSAHYETILCMPLQCEGMLQDHAGR